MHTCLPLERMLLTMIMRTNRQPFVLLLGIALGLHPLAAQPQAGPANEINFTYSRSTDNPLAGSGGPAGEIGVNATRLAWKGSAGMSPSTRISYGLNWENFDFQRPAAAAVPDSLREVSVLLGASHRLDRNWLLIGTIRPGWYGDGEGTNGDAFNAPVLLVGTWLQSPTLAWSFGLRADLLAERPVLPFVGVRWKFSPDWEFVLGMPRTGINWSLEPDWKLGLGVTLQGGNFHVGKDPRPAPGLTGPRLDDTTLDYHEIRVGLSAEWQINPALALTFEAGVITDQKFDYFDRDFSLDGDRTAFFSLGLTGKF